MVADELLPVCSWDFSPDPANVYSLCVVTLSLTPLALSLPARHWLTG